jgi:hypothetical protein
MSIPFERVESSLPLSISLEPPFLKLNLRERSMKSMRRLLLLGTLAFTLTGCTPISCDFDDNPGIKVSNNSSCIRGLAVDFRVNQGFVTQGDLEPGETKVFRVSGMHVRIDPHNCPGTDGLSKFFFIVKDREEIVINPDGSISRD